MRFLTPKHKLEEASKQLFQCKMQAWIIKHKSTALTFFLYMISPRPHSLHPYSLHFSALYSHPSPLHFSTLFTSLLSSHPHSLLYCLHFSILLWKSAKRSLNFQASFDKFYTGRILVINTLVVHTFSNAIESRSCGTL